MTPATIATTGSFAAGGARCLRRLRAHGVPRAAYALAQKLGHTPVTRRLARLCVVDVFRAGLPEWKANGCIPRGFEVRQAGPADLPLLAGYFGSQERAAERLQRGDRCLAALAQDAIGAAVWFSLGPNAYADDWDDLRCVFRFPAGVAWSFDGRGTQWGAWGSLMVRAPQHLQDLGAEEVFTLVEWNNWKSIDSHRSLGWRRVAVLGCLRVAPLVWRLYSADGRRWHVPPGRIGRLEVLTSLPARAAMQPPATPLPRH